MPLPCARTGVPIRSRFRVGVGAKPLASELIGRCAFRCVCVCVCVSVCVCVTE